MKKVTWGATSSGFLLAATIRKHLRDVEPEAGKQLGDHLYADDFLQSFPDESQAVEYVDRLRRALSSADMTLAKWKTNSENVKRHLVNVGVEATRFQSNQSNLFKVLGINWSPDQDDLGFHIPSLYATLRTQATFTKRAALSTIASVYDPLGWLVPLTLRGKLLIRQLWSVDLQWDDPIPETAQSDLLEWSKELLDLQEIRIRRHYALSTQKPESYHLYVFADASPAAFASAAYIEYRGVNGHSSTALLMCKSRLAPIDSPPTLPRLELLAALLAVRLNTFIVERINTFVHNRVEEIQRQSTADQWYHVQGEHSIADLATRGITARALRESAAWWYGPEWLHLPDKEQPVSRPRLEGNSFDIAEREIPYTSAPATVTESPLPLSLELFNSAARATRVLANALRFARAARRQVATTVAELHQQAERILIRSVQARYFSKEIEAANTNAAMLRNSRLNGFGLFIDDAGVLRARTRLTEGPFSSYEEKNPIILPGESRFAVLLIYDAHRVNAHFGVSNVLSQVRRRFWITRGRHVIKAILNKCVICKRRQGRPAHQVEAPLPESRVTLLAPFESTGIDFCGPFSTRTTSGTQKAYIALFTCAATRAVHLELPPLMSTPQTHLAIRRFLAEHPACLRFVSDNGRSFVKAATDIKRLFNSVRGSEVREVLEGRCIEWNFNCPRAAWHGGFFERMIGVTKSALTKTLGKSLITVEEFRTIVKELAAVINDRPITYVETKPDRPTLLTPAQLIHGGPYFPCLASLRPLDALGPNGSDTGNQLRKSLAERTNYFKSLSLRWYKGYILQLGSAQRIRGQHGFPIQIGEVCLLKEDKVARIRWPLVRIVECHVGRDGNPRTYTIQTATGSTTRRAAQLLYPLEVVDTVSSLSSDNALVTPPRSSRSTSP